MLLFLARSMALLGALLALAHAAYLIWLGAMAPSGGNLDPTASPLAFARISSLLKPDILILAGSVSIGLLAQITDNLSKIANGTNEKAGKTWHSVPPLLSKPISISEKQPTLLQVFYKNFYRKLD